MPLCVRIEHKMTEAERDRIQEEVYDIANRVKKYGRDSVRVRVKVDMLLTDQAAINYKVIKLFANTISDKELVDLLVRLGVRNGAEIIKILAQKEGIQI